LKSIISSLFKTGSAKKDQQYNDFLEIQKIIKYRFKDPRFISAALSHTSLTTPNTDATSFERMEFLGDSVLGLVIAEELYLLFPEYSEGQLSKLKSKIVSKKFLALKAKEIKLGSHIKLSSEAENSGGRNSSSILADSMEALICALYLDGNYSAARSFIKKFIFNNFQIEVNNKNLTDYKSKLQEFTQARYQRTPDYKIIGEEGPEHEKIFSVEVYINSDKVGFGKGSNKKEAQQNAAQEALNNISEPSS